MSAADSRTHQEKGAGVTTHPFWKLHGLGNDFVFFDGMERDIELTTREVAALCDRHAGIGGDGVIVVKPSPRAECAGYMHYINADGTLAQMCGNGVRCFAKFLVDHGYVQAEPDATGQFVADTLAGPKPITFTTDAEGKLVTATVDMGAPILEPTLVPVDFEANATAAKDALEHTTYVAEMPIDSPWGTFAFTCVSMGNPHAICFMNDEFFETLSAECFTGPDRSLDTFDVSRIGPFFESHELFPEKTNVEFAVVEDDSTISMRVFERGCGETHACGTGACATQVAAHLAGHTNPQATLNLLGGKLRIELAGGHVIMTGPAAMSFSGTVNIKELIPW